MLSLSLSLAGIAISTPSGVIEHQVPADTPFVVEATVRRCCGSRCSPESLDMRWELLTPTNEELHEFVLPPPEPEAQAPQPEPEAEAAPGGGGGARSSSPAASDGAGDSPPGSERSAATARSGLGPQPPASSSFLRGSAAGRAGNTGVLVKTIRCAWGRQLFFFFHREWYELRAKRHDTSTFHASWFSLSTREESDA